MVQKVLPVGDLNSFLISLMGSYDVFAPVKDRNTHFRKIDDPKEMTITHLTEVTAKQLFIPENEILVEFKGGKRKKGVELTNPIKQRVIFGMRKCDLNAVQVLDKVMFDPQYLTKRRSSVLVGLFCENPDEYCFCNSMELKDYYDLFFYPKDGQYYISIGSEKGANVVKDLPDAKNEVVIPNPKNVKVLGTKDIEGDYENKIWLSDSKKCLSCSACTFDCPTCNCFDIRDEVDEDGKNVKRLRRQVSCMTKSFSRVGGGKVHRDSRVARYKQFVYHKIVTYKKKFGRPMCVGCGRCLRVCPTKIDWVETINLLKDFKGEKK